ncbi:MAG: hypothetical protein HQ503_18865 [Rhodospirillales bacterium]|nr:hypothetical protein [Rhodospirillales bacterium]
MGYFETLAAVKFTIVAMVFFIALKWNFLPQTRRHVVVWGAIWLLMATSEYWAFGNASYIFLNAELEYSLPINIFMNEWYDGGIFSHAFAGGNDVYAMAAGTGQFVSLERILLAIFPLWLASFFHKVMVFWIGFSGIYLISRRFAGLERSTAFALAALSTLAAHPFVTTTTWVHGVGYAISAMAIYLCVLRYGRRWYFTGIIALSILQAVSSTPTNSLVTVLAAVFFAALFFGFRRAIAVIPAILIIVLFTLFNWHESLYAKALVAPLTDRVMDHSFSKPEFFQILDIAFKQFGPFGQIEVPIIILAGLAVLLSLRHRLFGWVLIALLLSVFSGFVIENIPWRKIGWNIFAGYQFSYIFYSAFALAYVVAGFALGEIGRRKQVPWRIINAALMALMVGNFFWAKSFSISNWLSSGGLSVVPQVQRLEAVRDLRNKPIRVVTVPYRIPENMLAAAGLMAANGNYNLRLQRQAVFWNKGILKHPSNTVGQSTLLSKYFDFKCCDRYDIAEHANIDFLRISNVGYIFSKLPLIGGGLVQVYGPKDERAPVRRAEPIRQRLAGYFTENFEPSPIRTYAIANPLPMVFAASDLVVAQQGINDSDYMKLVGKFALQRAAVVRTKVKNSVRIFKSLKINEFQMVRDGVDISLDAPDGGVVIVNLPHTPFWQAEQNGIPLELFPTNQIHMGIAAPPGSKNIKLRYRRPLLRDKLFG